ncbi:MAG: hypothetical protein ACYTF2_15095, partial [Planctomycetota bacterium]
LFPDHVYVGNDIGVYFTANDGATWVQLAEGLAEAALVNELNISPVNRKLRAFTHGQGVFERDLIGTDCPADVDGDGAVGVTDFLQLLAAWGPCPECPEDIDGDGTVGVLDFLELLAAWGPCA